MGIKINMWKVLSPVPDIVTGQDMFIVVRNSLSHLSNYFRGTVLKTSSPLSQSSKHSSFIKSEVQKVA